MKYTIFDSAEYKIAYIHNKIKKRNNGSSMFKVFNCNIEVNVVNNLRTLFTPLYELEFNIAKANNQNSEIIDDNEININFVFIDSIQKLNCKFCSKDINIDDLYKSKYLSLIGKTNSIISEIYKTLIKEENEQIENDTSKIIKFLND